MIRRLLNWTSFGRLELEKMLLDGVKCEIEALSATSFSFLSEEYIPGKIQNGGYI